MLSKEEFSSRLKAAMDRKQLKQVELAEMIGVSPANISNYVKGKAFPPIDILAEIAKNLDVSLDWLCAITNPGVNFKEPETFGDIAQFILFLLSEIMTFAEISTSHIKKDRYPDLPDQYERSYKEEDVPSLAFTTGTIRTFLEDLSQMQELLKRKTFNSDFYKRWLEDRIKSLKNVPVVPPPLESEENSEEFQLPF